MRPQDRSPLHAKWHPRVEGQIRDCMTQHPDWFTEKFRKHQGVMVNSLAKRIVGEIVADSKVGGDTVGSVSREVAGSRKHGEAGCNVDSLAGRAAGMKWLSPFLLWRKK